MEKTNFKAKFEAQMKEFSDVINSGAYKLDGDGNTKPNKFKQLRLYLKFKNSQPPQEEQSHLDS